MCVATLRDKVQPLGAGFLRQQRAKQEEKNQQKLIRRQERQRAQNHAHKASEAAVAVATSASVENLAGNDEDTDKKEAAKPEPIYTGEQRR